MLRRGSLDRTIVEAGSAANAGIDAPAEKSHEAVQGTAPLNTRDVLGKTAGAYVVAEGHISTSPLKSDTRAIS
jgi:hypothetical protein